MTNGVNEEEQLHLCQAFTFPLPPPWKNSGLPASGMDFNMRAQSTLETSYMPGYCSGFQAKHKMWHKPSLRNKDLSACNMQGGCRRRSCRR